MGPKEPTRTMSYGRMLWAKAKSHFWNSLWCMLFLSTKIWALDVLVLDLGHSDSEIIVSSLSAMTANSNFAFISHNVNSSFNWHMVLNWLREIFRKCYTAFSSVFFSKFMLSPWPLSTIPCKVFFLISVLLWVDRRNLHFYLMTFLLLYN